MIKRFIIKVKISVAQLELKWFCTFFREFISRSFISSSTLGTYTMFASTSGPIARTNVRVSQWVKRGCGIAHHQRRSESSGGWKNRRVQGATAWKSWNSSSVFAPFLSWTFTSIFMSCTEMQFYFRSVYVKVRKTLLDNRKRFTISLVLMDKLE